MTKAEIFLFGYECMYTVPKTFYLPTWKVIERWVHAEQNLESADGLWTVGERRAQSEWWTHSERYVNARWTIYLECLKSLHVCTVISLNIVSTDWTINERRTYGERNVIVHWTHCVRERSGERKWTHCKLHSESTMSAMWTHGKMGK